MTILEPEEGYSRLHGRVKMVQSGAEKTFCNAEELQTVLNELMEPSSNTEKTGQDDSSVRRPIFPV